MVSPQSTPTQLALFVLEKACSSCGTLKPLDEFYPRPGGRYGRTAGCKQCIKAKQRAYNVGHREENRARSRAYHELHRDELNARCRTYYRAQCAALSGRAITSSGQKTCSACNQVLTLEAFHQRPDTIDGRHSRCRRCVNAWTTGYRESHADELRARRLAAYPKHREAKIAYCRAYYRQHRTELLAKKKLQTLRRYEAHLAYHRAYYNRTKDWKADYRRAYYAAHRGERIAYNRSYYANNAERLRADARQKYLHHKERYFNYARERRVRKSRAPGYHTPQEFRALCDTLGNTCMCCGSASARLQEDHFIPLSRGGSDDIENIFPLCKRCNGRKRDRLISYEELRCEMAMPS